jgi:hypothetical protein
VSVSAPYPHTASRPLSKRSISGLVDFGLSVIATDGWASILSIAYSSLFRRS